MVGDGVDVCRVSVVPMREGARKQEIWCSTVCHVLLSLLRHVSAVIGGSTLISCHLSTCPIHPINASFIYHNGNVHISVLNGTLCDMGQVRCGAFEIDWSIVVSHRETLLKNLTGYLCYYLHRTANVMFSPLLIPGLSVCLFLCLSVCQERTENVRIALTWH